VLPERFVPYNLEDEAILAKNEQIYKKALQKIKITDIGFGSYTVADVNNINLREYLDGPQNMQEQDCSCSSQQILGHQQSSFEESFEHTELDVVSKQQDEHVDQIAFV